MPVFAAEVLEIGARGFGVLMSATGAGALAGALFLARLGDAKHKGKIMVYAAFLFSASLIAFALCRVFFFSVVTLALVGGASVVAVALVNTILQTRVADAYRGRVMSVFMLTFAGMLPFGYLIAGSMAHAFGVSAAVLCGGAACLIFFSAVNLAYPQLRRV
jgi:MFS family permease